MLQFVTNTTTFNYSEAVEIVDISNVDIIPFCKIVSRSVGQHLTDTIWRRFVHIAYNRLHLLSCHQNDSAVVVSDLHHLVDPCKLNGILIKTFYLIYRCRLISFPWHIYGYIVYFLFYFVLLALYMFGLNRHCPVK